MKPVAFLQATYLFARLVRDPNELDAVFRMQDASRDSAFLESQVATLTKDARMRASFAVKARLGRLTFGELYSMPDGSLGRAYGEFMAAHRLDPDAIPHLPANDECEYMNAHLYETHDLWHVLTGFEPDIAGEAGLQGFYAAQLPGTLPAALVSAILLNACLRKSSDDVKARFDAVARGFGMGRRAAPLFGYPWREALPRSLSELRRDARID